MAAPPLHPPLPEASASMQITRAQATGSSGRGVWASAGQRNRMHNDEAAGERKKRWKLESVSKTRIVSLFSFYFTAKSAKFAKTLEP